MSITLNCRVYNDKLINLHLKINISNVKDINSVLEVTVYDEDRDHRCEFLGAVVIPLLKIQNGQKRWYALKERKLRSRAKGQNPQILLELNVVWNEVRFPFLIYTICKISGYFIKLKTFHNRFVLPFKRCNRRKESILSQK